MLLIVGVGVGHAREQVLEFLSGQQIAIDQRFLAEFGEVCIARLVNDDVKAAIVDLLAVGFSRLFGRRRHRGAQRLGAFGRNQRFAARVCLVHVQCLCVICCGDTQSFARFRVRDRICIACHVVARFKVHLLHPFIARFGAER